MSLELFPLDSQICHITLASYGWTDDDVKYIWKVSTRRRELIVIIDSVEARPSPDPKDDLPAGRVQPLSPSGDQV